MSGKAFNLSKGVFSFNGRKGNVLPKSGDYTAEMVGALSSNSTGDNIQVSQSDVTSISTALSNKAEWDSGFLQTGSILTWAENQTINTHVATNSAVTGFLYETAWAVDFYLYPSSGWRRLIATDIQLGKSYYCIKNASLPWTTWLPCATATPPEQLSLSLASGMTASNPCLYWKNQFGEVFVAGSVSGSITDETVIATLPAGFYLSENVERPATFTNSVGTRFAGSVTLDANGSIVAFPATNVSNVVFSINFVVNN